MKRKITFLIVIVFMAVNVFAQKGTLNSKIKIYFNHPVKTSVSTGTNAVYLNDLMDDTLIAYINRAKKTIDVAVYNTTVTSIVTAINSAYTRGVTVRWIYESTSSNTALSSLNSNIKKLGRTDGVGIMHNKFMIIDTSTVWTGSTNWTSGQITGTGTSADYNNTIIIKNNSLAAAYTTEFNEMWGGTGTSPNTTNSKFGASKTDNTPHSFNVNGTTVNLYFSPSDGTNTQIVNTINTANVDLYFGMYTFTYNTDATAITSRHSAGVFCAGIEDQFSQSYTPYTTLNTALGTSCFKVYTSSTNIYHNKFLIVDPSATYSDPTVLTGSHNWSSSANTDNDENTLIIHDATVANIYYQSFDQNFIDMGGSLPVITDVNDYFSDNASTIVYPNPSNVGSQIWMSIDPDIELLNPSLIVYDAMGNIVCDLKNFDEKNLDISNYFKSSGIYFYQLFNKNQLIRSDKIVIL